MKASSVFLTVLTCIICIGGWYFINHDEIIIGHFEKLNGLYKPYIYTKKSSPISLDKTYVINLENSPIRYATIQKSLHHHAIDYIRFNAVNGYKVILKDENNNSFSGEDIKKTPHLLNLEKKYKISQCLANEEITYFSSKDFYCRALSPGEIGIACSHMQIWQNIIDQKQKYALILEDDAIFADDAGTELARLLKNVPKNWDMIYIDYPPSVKNNLFDIMNNEALKKIIPNGERFSGMGAYIVSYEGAKKLLNSVKILRASIDDQVSMLINEKQILAYKSYKTFIGPDRWSPVRSDSIINNMGRPHTPNGMTTCSYSPSIYGY